jgi:hypothetical protein
MFPHHLETLERTSEHFSKQSGVSGLVLGGSIAHGFASAESDLDVMIVVSEAERRERVRGGQACFFSRELCSYAAGYVDGKYVSEEFLEEVAAKGSEPARFACQDARVVFSRSATLGPLLARAARYPREQEAERLQRFQAQFEAWSWYAGEALKRQDLPLLRTAVSKLSLFGGRIVLLHNQLLYPYHKWFLRVLATAPEQPPALLSCIDELARAPERESVERFGQLVREFRGWEIAPNTWSALFLQDSELTWLHGSVPIDDM